MLYNVKCICIVNPISCICLWNKELLLSTGNKKT